MASGEDEHALSQMPSTSQLSRNIRRWRQGEDNAPATPQERFGYEIPESYRSLDSGEQFLQFDSGAEDRERILIFASAQGLRELEEAQCLAGDATFKCSPSCYYYQLETIHVQIGMFSVPRLFALLPNKTRQTYDRLFGKLRKLCPALDPSHIILDFEQAPIGSLQALFPRATFTGCLQEGCRPRLQAAVQHR